MALSRAQAVGLVVLRTLVGWHFLYEGYYKLMLPGWSRAGAPLQEWSAAGYLQGASGPLAGVAHWLGQSAALPWIDTLLPVALVLVGLSLLLGLLTTAGCWGALALLASFYFTAIPLSGTTGPQQEGAYLIVNKNLIELAAVAVLLVFRTGRIAGLDLLWESRWRGVRPASREAAPHLR